MKTTTLKHSILFLFFIINSGVFAQILEPVKWSFSSQRISNDEAELIFKAKIDKTWHLYGTSLPEGGPVATSFNYDANNGNYSLIGKVSEPTGKTKFDTSFEMELKMFDKQATFKQKIKINTPEAFKITGYVEFMCCDDSRCLPPTEVPFEFKFDKIQSNADKQIDKQTEIIVTNTTDSNNVVVEDVEEDTLSAKKTLTLVEETGKKEKSGLFWIFVLGFLGGLLALITPCVFPMIPMTVSFFLRSSKSRKKAINDALFYGLFIVFIYVALGLGITLIFGANALNVMATSPIFNIIFFLLLVVFAVSFFGVFELQLPAKWTNALDSKADKTSGLISIFFMAFTLVLVSFSCTGPIVGYLLVEAAVSGSTLSPLLGMAGFATALAIPFSLLAVFPSWLKSMPKSGGWLNAVKVVLAFMLLAFSLKFLSIADLVGQWNLLTRPVFLSLWIVIFSLMGMYLLGKIKFSHDSDMPYVPVSRLFLSIAAFSFVVYMIPGLFGAPVKIISSFLPPMTTQEFVLTAGGSTTITNSELPLDKKAKYGPHGLVVLLEYEEGLAYAKEKNKPVFLDFTGHACANCKKMHADVWGDKKVQNILKNDYVIISLYVDDRTTLPETEQYISTFGGKERNIKTIGAKWSDFQAKNYGVNSQPYYILLDNDGNKLVDEAFSYNTDIDAFIAFLEKGKSLFKSNK